MGTFAERHVPRVSPTAGTKGRRAGICWKILFVRRYLPPDRSLCRNCSRQRYRDSLDNLTPADAFFDCDKVIQR